MSSEQNDFWANVSAVAVSPVAIAAGFAKGAYDASTSNGAFADGFSTTATPIIRAAREFGATPSLRCCGALASKRKSGWKATQTSAWRIAK